MVTKKEILLPVTSAVGGTQIRFPPGIARTWKCARSGEAGAGPLTYVSTISRYLPSCENRTMIWSLIEPPRPNRGIRGVRGRGGALAVLSHSWLAAPEPRPGATVYTR